DAAAEALAHVVIGLPDYHVLRKDAGQRLAALKQAFDRFAGTYRRADRRLAAALGADYAAQRPTYLPDVPPLGRTATADDVKAGKAICHRDGKSKLAKQELPALAVLKSDAKKEEPTRVLIVQAEVGPDDRVTYGVIMLHDVRSMPAGELQDVKSLARF